MPDAQPAAQDAKPTAARRDAPPPPAADAPRPDATRPSDAGRVLPLTPGVYVIADSGCTSPPNAGVRFYDGRGISGSATHACRATVQSRHGDTYEVDQSCIDTPAGAGSRSSEPQTITVHDAVSFTLSTANQSARFLYCDTDRLPEHLRQRMTQDG